MSDFFWWISSTKHVLLYARNRIEKFPLIKKLENGNFHKSRIFQCFDQRSLLFNT